DQDLEAIVAVIETLQANFYQEVRDEQGQLIQESSGTLIVKKPGRFIWSYRTPEAQEIISDGKNLWLIDLELEQVSVQPLTKALGSSPILLLTNYRAMHKDFEIRKLGEAFGLHWRALVPRVQDTEFYRIEIGLKGNQVREMKLLDHFDQTTVIRFSKVRVNHRINDEVFQYSVSDDLDVIGTAIK
ncbi:MAG: outer membrane lipoprotein chaperone LolA, partial [Gammaproteobacteria bacterium]|nr:outer membrane lipoprotein chaperone LolA [Gammaproteobacteria bacterium]